MRLTTARYYTPSGRSIQALGITPDVRGAGIPGGNAAVLAAEHEADLQPRAEEPGRHRPQSRAAAHRPAGDRQATARQAAGGLPEIRPQKPDETDFQLQQGVALAKAMVAQKSVSAN